MNKRDNEEECLANARLVSLYARKFGKGQWSFIGPGSEKKWYSMKEDSPQGIWDNLAEKMLLEFAQSGCPIFRATTPLSRGQLKSKEHGKLSIHFAAVQETIETIFRIIVSANQLSLFGAVAEMCEEYETLHDRSWRADDVMEQSIVLSAIKTEVSLESDDPAYQNFLFRQYEERVEKLSQQDKLSKFFMDAGFLSVVENGQYFMTKDTGDLTQFNTVACREYTLPREDSTWIQGNTKIGPVLEVTTSYLHSKHGVEIRIMSLSRDNTHSWVRIFHGSNKLVMDLNNNDTEIPEDQLEEQASQLDAKDFACRSKAKAKSQRREPAGSSPRIVPIERRNWIDIESGKHSLSEYEVSKKVIHPTSFWCGREGSPTRNHNQTCLMQRATDLSSMNASTWMRGVKSTTRTSMPPVPMFELHFSVLSSMLTQCSHSPTLPKSEAVVPRYAWETGTTAQSPFRCSDVLP